MAAPALTGRATTMASSVEREVMADPAANPVSGLPRLFVTNFNRNHTGVSATAASVVARQVSRLPLRLVGRPLPGAPEPIRWREAVRLSRTPPPGYPFVIWHVRRNNEMLSALIARDVLRVPIRIVFTSAAQRRHSAFPRALIARMDAVVATTRLAAGFVGRVAAVVPHGVDVERFVPAPDRAAAWAATGLPGREGIGIVGRVRPEKGTDLFVEAMLRVLPSRPGATAVVMGHWKAKDAPFQHALADRAAAAGLRERVIFLGEVGADRMPSMMRALTLLVASPRYEGFGVTPLEAMASGVPVVATRAGAYEELIEEGGTGHVVPLGDVEALTGRIASLLDDPSERERMARQARARVVERFSVEREVAGVGEVYERLWRGERFPLADARG